MKLNDFSRIAAENKKLIDFAKKSKYYKQFSKRKYRKVEGYSSWERIAAELAAYALLLETNLNVDATSKMAGILSYKIEYDFCPIYWVKKDLLDILLNVDLPEDLIGENLQVAAPYLIFNLPHNAIKDPEGRNINWIGVLFTPASDKNTTFTTKSGNYFLIEKSPYDKINWVAINELMIGYSVSKWLPLDKQRLEEECEYWEDKFSLTAGVLNKDDQQFTKLITKLVVQLILVLLYREDMITEEMPTEDVVSSSKGFGVKNKDKVERESLLNPIWLGKEKHKIKKTRLPSNRTRKLNPENYPYIVSGHWCRVVVGKREEGRRERKLIMPYEVLGPLKDNA